MLVYLLKNVVNGKGYVGITTSTLRQRWSTHVSEARRRHKRMPLRAAIRKYGPEAWERMRIAALERERKKREKEG